MQQPERANLKAWWHHFNFAQRTKKDAFEHSYKAHDTADHPVFGKPLSVSLKYASVQISTANAHGDLYVWGYIPVVVAKCGLYLKENATEVPGTFRVNGSNKRMRDLQAAFETPPRYGKNLDWKHESYTTHDVASVFRRYLTQMPEPVIPYDMYHLFRDALSKLPFNQEEAIATYKSLIRKMPKPNQYLLLYVLDLLSVFARKSDKNLMTATNLAVIFRPGLISHPNHEMAPHEHALSQKVLEFLIAQQDWFMLDISPPTPEERLPGGGSGAGSRHGHGGSSGGRNGQGSRSREMPSRNNTLTSGSVDHGTPDNGPTTWNMNAEAGPSIPRPRTGSMPVWPPQHISQSNSQQPTPAQQIIAQAQAGQVGQWTASREASQVGQDYEAGQLTEQITPPTSIPPSPSIPRERSNSAILHGGSAGTFTHSQRPSSPLNPNPHHPPTGHPNTLPRRSYGSTSPGPSEVDVDELMLVPSAASAFSADEDDPDSTYLGGGGWKLIGSNWSTEHQQGMQNALQKASQNPQDQGRNHGGFLALGKGINAGRREKKAQKEREKEEKERIKYMRRRTTMERTDLSPAGDITTILENPSPGEAGHSPSGITRSRTLPSRRKDNLEDPENVDGARDQEYADKENANAPHSQATVSATSLSRRKSNSKDKPATGEREKRVLKKQRRASQQPQGTTNGNNPQSFSSPTNSPMPTPALNTSRTLGNNYHPPGQSVQPAGPPTTIPIYQAREREWDS